MTMTDPIADLLTRIRNALQAQHTSVDVTWSTIHERMVEILKAEGYIDGFARVQDGSKTYLRVQLKYGARNARVISDIKRVSSPGRRVYVGADEIPLIQGGLGVVIMTTPRGVMTGRDAKKLGVGGEILCYIS